MSILPQNVGLNTEMLYRDQPTRTFLIENDQIVGLDEGIKAMRQAIDIALNIDRFKWQIYTSNFGMEKEDLPGNDVEYIESEIIRRVTECLMQDDRVQAVEDFVFIQNGTVLTVTFSVVTVFGTVSEEVTI